MESPPPLVRSTELVYQSSAAPAVGGVTLAGFIKNHAGLPIDPMRVYGKYALVYLLEGHGQYADALGTKSEVSVGDLIVVFPELAHTYGPRSGGIWSEFYIVFEGPLFDVWRARGLLDSARPKLRLEPIDYWLRRLEAIVDHGSELTCACRMQQFLADMVEHDRQSAVAAHDNAWLTEARRLMSALDVDPPLRPEETAEKLGLSYEVFRKKFSKLTGVAPAKFRDARLMDLASQLLKDRDRSLKEIARRCGFCDEFHFSRRFKQKIGLPPSEFRDRLP